ncbi:MAG: HAD hydrolase family protein, partial [Thermoleophilaceae bacterium]|nr:HAD hydrolase family protein [Thermoleophilaceae bacterium]
CHRAGAEVVIKSGRRRAQVMEDARLIGQSAYIFEMGAGLVVDGELTWLTGEWAPGDETVHEQIGASGAPALLLEAFPGLIEPHAPWHREREVSHLFRGLVDERAANGLLAERGHASLRLVDNGTIGRHETELDLPGTPRAYHLIPAETSKAAAVERHMRARGYAPGECIAVGDSVEDLAVAEVVGRFFLVGNADVSASPPVERTEAAMGEGFYEAVIRSLAESR